MEAMRGLVANVPDWVKRLDELNGQIEQRQLDLASVPENKPTSSARSMKNRGSTESLKPKDDGAAYPELDRDHTPPPAAAPTQSTPGAGEGRPPASPVSDRKTPSSLQRQTNEVMLAAQKRARATVRRPRKTESMLSGEGAVPVYKSRTMIIVYYDSFVLSFFEELVKFVSASRNLMRKAKMAAKVAQIKRLAELEMPEDDEDDDEDDDGELRPGDALIAADPKPAMTKYSGIDTADLMLRYSSTRGMDGALRSSGAGLLSMGRGAQRSGFPGASSLTASSGMFSAGGGDVYDQLDKGLEFVQSMCEHAAHQFLRDGDCAEEIEKIQKRLQQVRDGAEKEMERSLREDPPVETEPEPPKTRSYRPMSMRRDFGALNPNKSPSKSAFMKEKIEVDDEGVQDMDDLPANDMPPKAG